MTTEFGQPVVHGGISSEEICRRGLELGLVAVGVAPAEVAEPARTVLTMRKEAGLAGDMQFTYRNPQRSTDPLHRMPSARSIVVAALAYETAGAEQTAQPERPARPETAGRIARYSWQDHYALLAGILADLARPILDAGHRCQILIDSNHLVDRHVAWRAGIGWYGKNANLLIPGLGSWFVLGSILTEAPLEPTGRPLDDGCGPCQRCIDDCPTAAIVAPGIVDARRCIAWLVQAGGEIPSEFRVAVGDRLYGCDECQEVCPPNRAHPPTAAPTEPKVDLGWVLTAPDDEILERLGRWYIADRNVDVIRRTALVVLGNTAVPTWSRRFVADLLNRYLTAGNAVLRNHAVWAARRLGLDGAAVELPLCCGRTASGPHGGLGGDDPCEDPGLHRELTQPVERRIEPEAWGVS
ncbi:MAG: tRNA epoxyqueuosine(34) reductase QueG [Acidimicrobiia bacterium]|nr:tRNA epoxyqueuosine(34) reductase QueG [Acidimicrobiia bacterium]